MLTIIWEQIQDMSVLSSLKWFRNHEQQLYLRKRGGLVVKNYIAVLEAVEGKALKKNEGKQNLDKFHN